MRADNLNFAAATAAKAVERRHVIELAFDSGNIVLWHFTSHPDTATPPAASVVADVVEGLSVVSQRLNPDKFVATIGSISFRLVNKNRAVSNLLASQLAVGRSTRGQRVRVYEGHKDHTSFANDYTLIQTQIVDEISYHDGVYTVRCRDIQRQLRRDIFVRGETTLTASIGETDLTIPVVTTDGIDLVEHGTSYSDAPGATVLYLEVDNPREIIRCSGKTPTSFTVDGATGRGALNTLAAAHNVDTTVSPDRRTRVTEYIYLEMPVIKLIKALETGALHGQGAATLPANYHLGIDPAFINEPDFLAHPDLWDPADDTKGRIAFASGEKKTDGKRFIEEQLMPLIGAFHNVRNDGALGLRRMVNILSGAAPVAVIDASVIAEDGKGALRHDFKSLHNQIQIDWNWDPVQERTRRSTVLIDAASIAIHEPGDPFLLSLRLLHGSRHSSVVLSGMFDALRDRYTGPPDRITLKVLPKLNHLEVGDVVRVILTDVPDMDAGENVDVDRAFEVHHVAIDWINGNVTLELFASTQAPSAIAATLDVTVLTDAWYESIGTDLRTVLTIVGTNPGTITVNGNLAAGTYWFPGDLILGAGVTVTINGTVRLHVRGTWTPDGIIDGIGRGHPGAVAPTFTNPVINPVFPDKFTDHTDGTVGFIGATLSAGNIQVDDFSAAVFSTLPGHGVSAGNTTVPAAALTWDGTTLDGVFADLQGSSGSSGNPTFEVLTLNGRQWNFFSGGNGGPGGAGLITVSRGVAFGAAGRVNLSGGPGLAGQSVVSSGRTYRAGSGAGGAGGGWLAILDGALANVPVLAGNFISDNGATPILGTPIATPDFALQASLPADNYPNFVGFGDGTTFPLPSASGNRGGARVQFVPGNLAAEPDPAPAKLSPPLGLNLVSGTAELADDGAAGTVIPRIRATVTPSTDPRVIAYEFQFKESALTNYQTAPLLTGGLLETFLFPVRSGINHDVRVRALGPVRLESAFVTALAHTVIGKTAAPSDVTGLLFNDTFFTWADIADKDKRGYVVRFQPSAQNNWDTATPAHEQGFLTDTRFDTRDLVGGSTRLLVKAIDTSGLLSLNAASIVVDLRPVAPNVFLISRQPDGTREFTFSTTTPPADIAGAKIRFFLGTTSDWTAMTSLHEGLLVASPFESNLLAAGTYTFAIKNFDLAGNESATATFITTTIGDPRIKGAIINQKEEPTWAGTKTSSHVDVGTGFLVADGTATWSTLPATWAGWTVWNNSPVSPIQYQIQLDLGAIAPFVPLVAVTVDGTPVIEEQHSDDDISYTAFAAIGPLVTARFIRIRVTVTGSYPKIKTMRTILSGDPVTEVIEDLDTSTLTGLFRLGVGDVRLPIVKTYGVINKVGITLQGTGGGFTSKLIDKDTTTGPRVQIYDATDTLADATIDADIRGL